jgi:hypothetical protein
MQRHHFSARIGVTTHTNFGGKVRRRLNSVLAITAVIGAAIAGGCSNPKVDLQQWDEIQALQASVGELRSYTGELEMLIDSLNKVVLRQDTALRLIVDFTGAQVPAYKSPGG